MDHIRVRRLDGVEALVECKNSKANEGTINSAVGWEDFLASLPCSKPSKRPVALLAHAEDLEFEKALDAHNYQGYAWGELLSWLERHIAPRPRIDTTALPKHSLPQGAKRIGEVERPKTCM